MSDTLYIKPDKEKTYSVNSEEELNYYKSLRPVRLWSRTHFKYKCSKCHEDKDILLLNLKLPFICHKCIAKINANKESTKERRKATCLIKYGVEYIAQLEETKVKMHQTCMERYGYEHAAQVPEFIEKQKKTNLERYGVTCTLNTQESIDKKKQTWLDHYGVDNPNKSKDIIEKRIDTNRKKYGTEFYLQTEEYKQRSMKSKLEKYGDAFYSGFVIYYYDNIFFRSKPELCFYIYNKDQGKDIVYEPQPYFKYKCEDKEYYYKPDFLLENKLYEIKGDYFFDDAGNLINPYDRSLDNVAKAKQLCMEEHNVTVLKSDKYMFYVDYVKEKYGTDYIETFRYKKED